MDSNTVDLTLFENENSNTVYNIKLDYNVADTAVQEIDGLFVSITD